MARTIWTDKQHQARAADVRDGMRFNRYAGPRRQMEMLWELASKPIKFPAPTRRRRDREWPKAA